MYPCGLFSPVLPPNSPAFAPYVLHVSPTSKYLNGIWWTVNVVHILIMPFLPLLYYLFPLRPKHIPQHPFLRHPKPTFLPQYGRPSFTPIQNNTQNYSFVYLKRLPPKVPWRCNSDSHTLDFWSCLFYIFQLKEYYMVFRKYCAMTFDVYNTEASTVLILRTQLYVLLCWEVGLLKEPTAFVLGAKDSLGSHSTKCI